MKNYDGLLFWLCILLDLQFYLFLTFFIECSFITKNQLTLCFFGSRKNCFTSDYFKGCLDVLLLQDEMENIQDMIKQLHGAEPAV